MRKVDAAVVAAADGTALRLEVRARAQARTLHLLPEFPTIERRTALVFKSAPQSVPIVAAVTRLNDFKGVEGADPVVAEVELFERLRGGLQNLVKPFAG